MAPLTQKGKLTSGLISALESLLRTSNIDLVIVTGRSIGWENLVSGECELLFMIF